MDIRQIYAYARKRICVYLAHSLHKESRLSYTWDKRHQMTSLILGKSANAGIMRPTSTYPVQAYEIITLTLIFRQRYVTRDIIKFTVYC